MGRTFAYMRVSKHELTTENQRVEIVAAGFAIAEHRMIAETISGSVPALQRPQFAKLVDRLEPSDRIICTKLDRLGRNAMDVRSTVDLLASKEVHVHCLALGGADLTSSAGRMTMMVIAAVAEFERDLLIERTQAGLKRAVDQGRTLGRRPSLTQDQQAEVVQARGEGVSLAALSKRYGVSRAAIQRVEKRAAAGA